MAPTWSLVAVAVALAAPAQGQESLVLKNDYQQADCVAGSLHRQMYMPAGQCMTHNNKIWNCSSGVPTEQSCPGAASESSMEFGSCDAEGSTGGSRQYTCSTPAAYAVMEIYQGDTTCAGDPADARAYPLDVCWFYTEDDGSVKSDKLTTAGLFGYEGVADCSGAGQPSWNPEIKSGACVAYAPDSVRIRVVGFTPDFAYGAGFAAGAAKAGPALASALLALAAAAAA